MARLVAGVGEMCLSASPADQIVIHGLGSCVGLAIYDPGIRAGGILHYMLPHSRVNWEKALCRPCLFADTGIPLLLRKLDRLGVDRHRMIVKVAGASQIMDERGVFDVGRRNYLALREIFWKTGILIGAEDVGGARARTMTLEIATGAVWIASGGGKVQL